MPVYLVAWDIVPLIFATNILSLTYVRYIQCCSGLFSIHSVRNAPRRRCLLTTGQHPVVLRVRWPGLLRSSAAYLYLGIVITTCFLYPPVDVTLPYAHSHPYHGSGVDAG